MRLHCSVFRVQTKAQNAPLAQLVEQLTLNQWVRPGRGLLKEERRWPVGQAVKTAASHAANMGSIPVRVTIYKMVLDN